MKLHGISVRLDAYLEKKLSGSTFTWREILKLTFPSILDSLSIMFIGMLITALISENGETSVAAVSLVGPISSLISCMFNGIGAGGTVVVAQCKGRGDPLLVKRASGMIIWLTVAVGAVTCLPFLVFPRPILTALYPDAEPIVMEKAVTYLSGCVWTILVFTVYNAIFSVLRGLGESQKCLVLSVIINGAYLIFSLLFLNMLHMDIQGSVLALLLARLVGVGAAIVSLFFYHPPIAISFRHLFSFDKSVLFSTLKVSVPLGLEQIFASCGGLVSQMYLIKLGTTAVATNAIANSLFGLLYAPASAMANVAVAVVGRCIGAGRQEEAYTYGKRCCQMALGLLIIASIVFYPALPLLLKTYHPTPEAASQTVQILMASIPCLLLFWPVSNIMPSVLRAASDTVFPSVLSLVVLWTVNIGMGYVLAIPMGMGLWGVWVATWSAWAIRTALFHLRYRSRLWLRKVTLKPAMAGN